MARNIPKALATFVSSDPEIARMYSNVQAAVQPLLDFYNRWFSASTAGRLTILGSVASQVGSQITVLGAGSATGNFLTSFRQVPDGTQAAPGLAFATNGASGVWHTGGNTASEMWNIVMQGVKQISVTTAATIFQAPPNGAVAIFNDASGNNLGTINGQGVVNMPSFVSAQGFRYKIPAGFYWNSSYTSGQVQSVIAIANGTSPATTPWAMPMDRAGSVTGVTTFYTGGTSCIQTVIIQKNGVTQQTINIANGGNGSRGVITFDKGRLTFAAGDYYIVYYTFSVAGNVCIQTYLTFEFGA
jgi:hypothetical protein